MNLSDMNPNDIKDPSLRASVERLQAGHTVAAKRTVFYPNVQRIGHYQVRILKNKAGQRAAEITPSSASARRFYVPVEMLSLAAGKDKWMRQIEFKCRDCRKPYPASKMECELCPDCYERAEQENELDNSR